MDIYAAVAESSRREILDLLRGGERAAGELVDSFPALSQPAVSRHLRILREVGLVAVRAEGQRRVYALRTEPLRSIDSWLEGYRAFWNDHLDALGRHLAAESKKEATTAGANPSDEERST